MLFRKIFENLRIAMAILVLFEQFLRNFCLNFKNQNQIFIILAGLRRSV